MHDFILLLILVVAFITLLFVSVTRILPSSLFDRFEKIFVCILIAIVTIGFVAAIISIASSSPQTYDIALYDSSGNVIESYTDVSNVNASDGVISFTDASGQENIISGTISVTDAE